MHHVTSADGTAIAVETRGSGPAVVLVGGAFNDRSTVAGLADALADGFTAVTYDRRGRGDSGDTRPWSLEREFEDLRAVVEDAGGDAALFGHSSGAILVLEAVAAGVPARRVVAYEPPWKGVPGLPPVTADELRALLAAGDRGGAVEAFLTRAAGVPQQFVAGMRQSPDWAWFDGLAHTLPYDVAITGTPTVPAGRLASIGVPALVVDGGDSPAEMRAAAAGAAAAIPGARYETLGGEDHAILQRPAALVPLLREFLR